MNDSEFRSNIKSDVFWLRTVYTVIFLIVARVLDLLLLLLTLVQWIARLLGNSGNESLDNFCFALGEYYRQVVHFLTGCSEEKPYPFSDWPRKRLPASADEVDVE